MFGLVSEKKYKEADEAWVTALNHISYYLMQKQTPKPVIKNLVELLVHIDVNKELIDDYMCDWKDDNCNEDYHRRLNVICPLIIKAQKKLEKEMK